MRVVASIFLMFALAGCTKYTVDCDLTIQPRLMVSAGSDIKTPAIMARAYVWYVSEKEAYDQTWIPESYSDAEAGIVRHRTSGEERSYDLWGAQSEEDTYVHITITSSPMMLVALDPVNKMYAYRSFKYQAPIEQVVVPVTFKPYQQTPYKENDWIVISERDENDTGEE